MTAMNLSSRGMIMCQSPSLSLSSISPPTPPDHAAASSSLLLRRICRSSSSALHHHLPSPQVNRVWVSPAFSRSPSLSALPASSSGTCRASQAIGLFPSILPEVIVRDARAEDCWEVADTHCSCFFPYYTFPVDVALRIDRFIALLSGFSVPAACTRSCLVAILGTPADDRLYIGCEDFKIGGSEGKFSINKGYVAGILSIDTVADFLPRKGPLRQRRTGIAYISNVAVRESERQKGIAKMLIAKAEARARSWGCRSVALHCDASNFAAMRLYKGQGFKCIKVPQNARWPEPKTSPNIQFNFMMKLVSQKQTP